MSTFMATDGRHKKRIRYVTGLRPVTHAKCLKCKLITLCWNKVADHPSLAAVMLMQANIERCKLTMGITTS